MDQQASQERKEIPSGVVLLGCMDEDIDYEPGMLVAGVAGSAITHLEGGDEKFFPIEQRKRVEKLRPALYKALEIVSQRLGKKLLSTSHTGCGWLKKQGLVTPDEMAQATENQLDAMGIPYAGHIHYAKDPIDVGDSGLKAHIGRPEENHHHGARSVVITVGGFITEEEIQNVSTEYGDAFIISADWVEAALLNNLMTEEDAMFLIGLQIDVADGIADGVSKDSSCRIFDAQRLGAEITSANRTLVERILESFK